MKSQLDLVAKQLSAVGMSNGPLAVGGSSAGHFNDFDHTNGFVAFPFLHRISCCILTTKEKEKKYLHEP